MSSAVSAIQVSYSVSFKKHCKITDRAGARQAFFAGKRARASKHRGDALAEARDDARAARQAAR
jgi:hypothetical protein